MSLKGIMTIFSRKYLKMKQWHKIQDVIDAMAQKSSTVLTRIVVTSKIRYSNKGEF